MSGIGHSMRTDGISNAKQVLPGDRYVFFDSVHFQVDPAVFTSQFDDVVKIDDTGSVTADHL